MTLQGPRAPTRVTIVVMATIPAGAREFLRQGALAHIVTLEPDGSPHVSLAWAGADDDGVVWSTFSDQHKLDNLRRDPRIALSFEAHEAGDEPLHPYLVISGRARIEEGGALDVMDSLSEFYPGTRVPLARGTPGVHGPGRRRQGVRPGFVARRGGRLGQVGSGFRARTSGLVGRSTDGSGVSGPYGAFVAPATQPEGAEDVPNPQAAPPRRERQRNSR